MSLILENWREEELSVEEVAAKHPQVPFIIILKTDVQHRGFLLSETAKEKFRQHPEYQQLEETIFYHGGENKEVFPSGFLFRDGTTVIRGYAPWCNPNIRDPYVIDVKDDKFVLTDQGKVYEEIDFWEKPDYYFKTTSKGTPMMNVLTSRPQRIDISISRDCHFWDKKVGGGGCKFCPVGVAALQSDLPSLYDYDEITETLTEALKQEGRFTSVYITTGAILSGDKLFDDEIKEIYRLFDHIGPLFNNTGNGRIKSQLMSCAYDKEQLTRLYHDLPVYSYTADIEVLNRDLFKKICPGKSKHVGYDGWKRRLYDAAEVFDPGTVNTGLVAGVEMARPYGFKTEEEALDNVLSEVEDLAAHGVSTAYTVWMVAGMFRHQVPPSLDYYVTLAEETYKINRHYKLDVSFDDYRRCGNHPATDMDRI